MHSIIHLFALTCLTFSFAHASLIRSKKRKADALLRDTNNEVGIVQPMNNDVVMQSSSQQEQQPAMQEGDVTYVPRRIKRLLEQGKYIKVIKLGENMNNDEFLMQVCPAVKTFEQYTGMAEHLRQRNLVAGFYAYGDIEVVREAIVESKVYANWDYCSTGDLETALPLAFINNDHNRVIELLKTRKEVAVGIREQEGLKTGLRMIVSDFIGRIVLWCDGIPLKRFLTQRGDELREKHPDILDAICRGLVQHLSVRIKKRKAKKFLRDLIGQPHLLTPEIFAEEFLHFIDDKSCSRFIKYAWDEAVVEGLKEKYWDGGEKLWRVMKKKHPRRFRGKYPPNDDALAAIREYFPTKQEMEEDWVEENAEILSNKLKRLRFVSPLLLGVLWPIVAEYAISWTDV